MLRPVAGRPRIATEEGIQEAAFELFHEHGFDAVTMEEIAEHAGVSRRTLFRYFGNKAEIVWSGFEQSLQILEIALDKNSKIFPLREALLESILEFNRFPPDEILKHRNQAQLIFESSVLLSYSSIKYADWKLAISDFLTAQELGKKHEWFPALVAELCLAASISAYTTWLNHENLELESLLSERLSVLWLGLSQDLVPPIVVSHKGK